MERADVIIVGAGACGLSAAHTLKALGKSVIVLEAENRAGGRIKTVHDQGVVEAGAEFVHGEHAVTWEFIRALGLRTKKWESTNGSRFDRKMGEQGSVKDFPSSLSQEMEELREKAYSYDGPDMSLEEYFAELPFSPDARHIKMRDIAILENTDPALLSVLGLAQADQQSTSGHENFFLPDGYDAIVQHLANGVEMRLCHPVVSVAWNPGHAVVTCDGGVQFEAEKVLITASIGVMQQNPPTFIPELPGTFTDAVHAIGFGNVTKVVLWVTGEIPTFQILSTTHGINFWQRTWDDERVLVGYTGGRTASDFAALSEAEAIERAVTALEDALDPAIRERIVHARHFTWSDNPHVRGGYSYPTVGMGSAREIVKEPIMSTLFYAGEATHANGHAATVHGAIEEGRAVAQRISLS